MAETPGPPIDMFTTLHVYDRDNLFLLSRAVKAMSEASESTSPHDDDGITIVAEFNGPKNALVNSAEVRSLTREVHEYAYQLEHWWGSVCCFFAFVPDEPSYSVVELEDKVSVTVTLWISHVDRVPDYTGTRYKLRPINIQSVQTLSHGLKTLPNLYRLMPIDPHNPSLRYSPEDFTRVLKDWCDSYTRVYAWEAVRRYVRARHIAFFWWGLGMQRYCALGGLGRYYDKRSFEEMEGTSGAAIELPPAVRKRR